MALCDAYSVKRRHAELTNAELTALPQAEPGVHHCMLTALTNGIAWRSKVSAYGVFFPPKNIFIYLLMYCTTNVTAKVYHNNVGE